MGYTTYFNGEFVIDPPLSKEHIATIQEFSRTDHRVEPTGFQAPEDKPGIWCDWTVDDDGKILMWDEGEKFYDYTDWLAYLLKTFFVPWGHTLNGEIHWEGEESDDRGVLEITDNILTVRYAIPYTYGEPQAVWSPPEPEASPTHEGWK